MEASSAENEMQVSRLALTDSAQLLAQLDALKAELPVEQYNSVLDDVAVQLGEVGLQVEGVKADFYDYAERSRPDFDQYKRTSRFRHLWTPIEQAQRNRAANVTSRERARDEVGRLWGDRGSRFLEYRDGFQWVQCVRRFAKKVQDYDRAMVIVNRVMYQRRLAARRGLSTKLLPGVTDLENALALSRNPDQCVPLTENELMVLGPNMPMRIGVNGVVEYGQSPALPVVAEAEEDSLPLSHAPQASTMVATRPPANATTAEHNSHTTPPPSRRQSAPTRPETENTGSALPHSVLPMQNEQHPSVEGSTVQTQAVAEPVADNNLAVAQVVESSASEGAANAVPRSPHSLSDGPGAEATTGTTDGGSGSRSQAAQGRVSAETASPDTRAEEINAANQSQQPFSSGEDTADITGQECATGGQDEQGEVAQGIASQAAPAEGPNTATQSQQPPPLNSDTGAVQGGEDPNAGSQQPIGTAIQSVPDLPQNPGPPPPANVQSEQPAPLHVEGETPTETGLEVPTGPGASAAARTENSQSPTVANGEADCFCVVNEYMTRQTMEQVNVYPKHHRKNFEPTAFDFIRRNHSAFQEAYHQQVVAGKELLCLRHLQQLAKLLGLKTGQEKYGTLLKRLAYIGGNAGDYATFETDFVKSHTTYYWFRHGRQPALEDGDNHILFPYRFNAINNPREWIKKLEDRVATHGKEILNNLLAACGKLDSDPAILLGENGFFDIPLFDWLFVKSNEMEDTIADIAVFELQLHQAHLRTQEQIGRADSPFVVSHQYGLVQQLLEQDPLLYLLNVLLNSEPIVTMVSYPQPVIAPSNTTETANFIFPANPNMDDQDSTASSLRTLIPITMEDSDCCDGLLHGCLDKQDLLDFLAEYEKTAAAEWIDIPEFTSGYHLDSLVLEKVVRKSDGRFRITKQPMALGSARFLSSRIATTHYGASHKRMVLQPQLIPLPGNTVDRNPTLSNGITLGDLRQRRKDLRPIIRSPFGVQYQRQRVPAWNVADTLPGISPLSAAVQQQRSFLDTNVLAEISFLLTTDANGLAEFIMGWRRTARALVNLRHQMLQEAEDVAYGPKSVLKETEGENFQSEDEMEIEEAAEASP